MAILADNGFLFKPPWRGKCCLTEGTIRDYSNSQEVCMQFIFTLQFPLMVMGCICVLLSFLLCMGVIVFPELLSKGDTGNDYIYLGVCLMFAMLCIFLEYPVAAKIWDVALGFFGFIAGLKIKKSGVKIKNT